MTNPQGFTSVLDEGATLGEAVEARVISPEPEPRSGLTVETVRAISTQEDPVRRRKLVQLLREHDPKCPDQEREALYKFWLTIMRLFSLDDGDRGETGLIQMEINTGDTSPIRQPMRRMPFVVRQEIAKLLKQMEANGVIQPSKPPWSSPVVLIRKKDGRYRFCIDYRKLNSVTTAENFPLLQIDDLLDQLGKSRYFSTLDLASGFWQIRVHQNSQEKTAFSTPQGLLNSG